MALEHCILTIKDVTITRTVTTSDSLLGGCMVFLSVPVGTGCTGNFVTFSCSGNFTTKDRAYRMFDMAQMAYAMNQRVTVYVDNTNLQNGYCFAKKIAVYN